jgi:hypothetical protein
MTRQSLAGSAAQFPFQISRLASVIHLPLYPRNFVNVIFSHFVDRSAFFTNSFRQHLDIVSAKQKRSAASLNLPEAYFTCEPFGSP